MKTFTSNGVSDWLIQRVTAIIIAQYVLFLLLFICFTPDLDFAVWAKLFRSTFMRISTLIAVLCMAAHAWIGLWTIGTDYIKPTAVRLVYQSLILLGLLVLCLWTAQIVWGF